MDEFSNEGQIGQELFEDFLKPQKKKHFFGFRKRNTFPQNRFTIILTYERLLLMLIVLIIILIFFFSMGVEKGKRIEFATKLAERHQPSGISTNKSARYNISVARKDAQIKNKSNIKQNTAVTTTVSQPQQISDELDFGKPYTIQVVTYLKKDLVNRERTVLKISGYGTFIIPSGEFFQICTGTYASKRDAAEDLKKLKKRYKDCFIRKHGKR